jgi:hypothetical protein
MKIEQACRIGRCFLTGIDQVDDFPFVALV